MKSLLITIINCLKFNQQQENSIGRPTDKANGREYSDISYMFFDTAVLNL